MTEMTRRERILAASRKQMTDRLPFLHWWRHMQIGWAERECRNRGMGLAWTRPCYGVKMNQVVVTEEKDPRREGGVIRITYHTPKGTVYMDEKRDPGTFQWHADRSWKDVTPWALKRLIREPQDYEVMKFIVKNTEYVPDYFPIEQVNDWLGEEGVSYATLPKTPMARMMIEWIGSEGGRFYIHHRKYRDKVDELYEAFCQSITPLYEIVAKSPADIIFCGENIEGLLISPPLFEKYFLPEYERMAKIFHAHGKLMAVHMDGRLNVLKELIARTPIDIIEAFHPPPMGDLPLGEALKVWKDKVIWMGFPGAIYELGPEEVKKYTFDLLKEIGTGERLVVAMSTENIVSNENMLALTSIFEKADLPLTSEKIERIKKEIR